MPLMQAAADASFHEARDRVAFRDPVVSERADLGGTTLTTASVAKDQLCNQFVSLIECLTGPEIACRSVAGFRTTMGASNRMLLELKALLRSDQQQGCGAILPRRGRTNVPQRFAVCALDAKSPEC